MGTYLLQRLMQSLLILLGVSFITFFLLFVLPADPCARLPGVLPPPKRWKTSARSLASTGHS